MDTAWNVRLRVVWALVVITGAHFWVSGPGVCSAELVVPDMGLPEAHFGKVRITFMPNGAFVASRAGAQFMDGGLGFASQRHQRWGEQIRGSRGPDMFRVAPSEGAKQGLKFSGELRDTGGEALLRFEQRVLVSGEVLRLEYKVAPIEPISLDRLGLTFHFPVRRWAGQRMERLPGFSEASFPRRFVKGQSKDYLGQWVARRLAVGRDSPWQAIISLDAPGEWMLFDDRAWELNTFRLWVNRRVPRETVAEQGLSFAFEISFSPPASVASGIHDLAPAANRPPDERARRSSVTFGPDGSFSIWNAGRRVAEAGLSLLAPKVKYDPDGPDRDIASLGAPKWLPPGKELTDVRTHQWNYARPTGSPSRSDRAGLFFSGVLPQTLWDIPLTCLGDVAPVRDGLHVRYKQHATEKPKGRLTISYELQPSPALMAQLQESQAVLQPGLAVHVNAAPGDKAPKAATRQTQLDLSWGDGGHAGLVCPTASKWIAVKSPKTKPKCFHALFAWPASKEQDRGPAETAKAKAKKPRPADRFAFQLDLDISRLLLPVAPDQRPQETARRDVGWAAPTNDLSTESMLILPDDNTTRGDWQGKYGTHAYILCGRYSPRSVEAGRGSPLKYRIYTGNPDDPARKWVSSLDASRFRSALWNPIEQNRRYSVWDDHGEVYPRGKGPDLFIDLAIPQGAFCLSLYFMESDWIQYRAYTISIFGRPSPDRHGLPTVPHHPSPADPHGLPTMPPSPSHRLLARTSVHDFFGGIYKRFLVAGPQQLTIKIARDDSTNATLAGLFLDRAPTLLPVPKLGDTMRKRPPRADDRIVSPTDPPSAAIRTLLKSYAALRRLQAQAADDSHELSGLARFAMVPGGSVGARASCPAHVKMIPPRARGTRSAVCFAAGTAACGCPLQNTGRIVQGHSVHTRGALAKLRDRIRSSLNQSLSPADRAAALWMLWQCQEQRFSPKHDTLALLAQWARAVGKAMGPQQSRALLRSVAGQFFASGDFDASETVHDSYLDALVQPGSLASKGVEDALKTTALQYFTLNADTRYGLCKWQQYLSHVTSHHDKSEAVKRLRAAAEQTYQRAQKTHAQSRGRDPSGYLLPIAALRHIRAHYAQTALTANDQKLLARAAKDRMLFQWGLDDYVQEQEALLEHYPPAPASYLDAIQAHLTLAQQTNDYTRALELARALSSRFPSSPEAARAQLLIVSDYYLYRRQYAKARTALAALEEASAHTKGQIAALRQRITDATQRKLLPIPGFRPPKLVGDVLVADPSAPGTALSRLLSGAPPRPATVQDVLQSYESLRQRQAQRPDTFYDWCDKTGVIQKLAGAAQSLVRHMPSDEDRATALWVLFQCQEHLRTSMEQPLETLRRFLTDVRGDCTRMQRLRILRDADEALFEARDFDALEVVMDHYLDAVGRAGGPGMALATLKRLAMRYCRANAWRHYGQRRWRQYLDRVIAECPRDRAIAMLRNAAREAASLARRESRARRWTTLYAYQMAAQALEAIRTKYGAQALTQEDRKLLAQAQRGSSPLRPTAPQSTSQKASTGK